MQWTANHPQDEELEGYCRGCLGDARSAHLEEHLLLCEVCRARLIKTEEFIAAVRQAGRQWLESRKRNQMTDRGAAAAG